MGAPFPIRVDLSLVGAAPLVSTICPENYIYFLITQLGHPDYMVFNLMLQPLLGSVMIFMAGLQSRVQG
jgi:hypothetical protein